MPSDSIRDTIERKARRAILEHAFFRIENAVILAGSILLAYFLPNPAPGLLPWWEWWTWIALGIGAVAALVISALTDQGERERAVERLFRQEYSTSGIRDKALQGKLKRAEEYHDQIKSAVVAQRDGVLKDRLKRTTGEVYDWIGSMVRLARRLDAYRSDPIILNDRKALQESIPNLERRLAQERDGRVRDQVETTLSDQRRLQANIAELDNRMKRADLQMDSSLAALGTVYSQLLLIGSKDVDSGQAERLQADISGEVSSLQDVVESINEVYDYQTLGAGK
jgi:hypothetical protein